MKRSQYLLLLVMCVLPLCVAVYSSRISSVMIAGPISPWRELGSITASQAIPEVTARTYTEVIALGDAKTFVWNLEDAARKLQMSFQTTADADATTIALLGFADDKSYDSDGAASVDDDAVYLGSLALTGGTQTGKHTNVYVDTIVATSGVASFTVLDSTADRRCVVEFTSKYKIIVGIATTLQASSTLYAEGRMAP